MEKDKNTENQNVILLQEKKKIEDQVGAMYLRFMDDKDSFDVLLGLLKNYSDQYDSYGQFVTSALADGLKNIERYINLENALSPRSIIIEKQENSRKIDSRDTEGAYHVVFVMDDESMHVVHFKRKQDQLLYMLMLLFSQKSGLLLDFFINEKKTLTPVQEAVIQLVKMVYPMKDQPVSRWKKRMSSHMEKNPAIQMVKDLSPNNSFSDILQKMKQTIRECLKEQNLSDDLYWFMPYDVNLHRKRLYRMHIPQTNIIFPAEFQPVIDALPDAAIYLKENNIDSSSLDKDWMNDFAKCKERADKGDAESLYRVGLYYGTGDVVAQDYEKSRKYMEEADRQGCTKAASALGTYYIYGFGVKKDVQKALSYLERAAKNGYAYAAVEAADIYKHGKYGVKVDHKKAFDLYHIAALQGNEEAMWYVLYGYLEGIGIKDNLKKSIEWIEIAFELEYYRLLFLFAIYLFDRREGEYLNVVQELFTMGVEHEIPTARYYMGRIVLRRDEGNDEQRLNEALKWFIDGANHGEKECVAILQKYFPQIYKEHAEDWKEVTSKRDELINQVKGMGNVEDQKLFIELVNAYRERWQESYLREICKQLRIHKLYDNKDEKWEDRRKIIVKKTTNGNSCYQIVLITVEGEEIPIKTFNPNALVLYILTIICSYKSGYSTEMTQNEECVLVMRQLVNDVLGEQYSDKYLNSYIEDYMSSTGRYYRQYSKLAKDAVCKPLDEMKDDPICFLFANDMIMGRKILRRMNLQPQNIELPQELLNLADKMPDALDVLKMSGNQLDTSYITE